MPGWSSVPYYSIFPGFGCIPRTRTSNLHLHHLLHFISLIHSSNVSIPALSPYRDRLPLPPFLSPSSPLLCKLDNLRHLGDDGLFDCRPNQVMLQDFYFDDLLLKFWPVKGVMIHFKNVCADKVCATVNSSTVTKLAPLMLPDVGCANVLPHEPQHVPGVVDSRASLRHRHRGSLWSDIARRVARLRTTARHGWDGDGTG